MRKLARLFCPDPDAIEDDYDDEDFWMRQQDWAVVGRIAVYGGCGVIILACLLRLFGVA